MDEQRDNPIPQAPAPAPPPPPPPPVLGPGYGYAQPARHRTSPWLWAGVGCGVLVLVIVLVATIAPLIALMGVGGGGLNLGSGNVAMVDVEGLIQSGGGGGGLFSSAGASSEPLMQQLRAAGEDSSIKAIVLNINSPGGSPAGSQAIAEEVWRLRTEKHKKVVATIGDLGASGGYYIAAQADQIVANPSSITGSIGVTTSELPRDYKLADRLGVEVGALTTGPYKDTGSPWRPMRPDEKALLEGILQDTYDQFVTDVARGRGQPVEAIRKLADGRVFTGRQALKVGLVDELGNLHDAIALAGRLAGIQGKPSVHRMRRATALEALLESTARSVVSTLVREIAAGNGLSTANGALPSTGAWRGPQWTLEGYPLPQESLGP